jgi:hypothetical protein
MFPPPTRREFVLVALVAVVVLYFFGSPSPTARPSLVIADHDSVVQEAPQVPEILHSRLTWGSLPVPATQLVSHAPG